MFDKLKKILYNISGIGVIFLKNGKVSNAVIRRLPRYYGQLNSLYQVGVVRISSSALAKSMNLTASQILRPGFCVFTFQPLEGPFASLTAPADEAKGREAQEPGAGKTER